VLEVGIPAITAVVAAWYHPTPQAVTAFGPEAK
jgi:hypothetical protein